jgi:hypothetical protein
MAGFFEFCNKSVFVALNDVIRHEDSVPTGGFQRPGITLDVLE